MSPEVADAIRIADQHLAGGTIDQRKALALDIVTAICRHAWPIAIDAIKRAQKSIAPSSDTQEVTKLEAKP